MTEKLPFNHPLVQQAFHQEVAEYARAATHVFNVVHLAAIPDMNRRREPHHIDGTTSEFFRKFWGLQTQEYESDKENSPLKPYANLLEEQAERVFSGLEEAIGLPKEPLKTLEVGTSDGTSEYVRSSYWALPRISGQQDTMNFLFAHYWRGETSDCVFMRVFLQDLSYGPGAKEYVNQFHRVRRISNDSMRETNLVQTFRDFATGLRKE